MSTVTKVKLPKKQLKLREMVKRQTSTAPMGPERLRDTDFEYRDPTERQANTVYKFSEIPKNQNPISIEESEKMSEDRSNARIEKERSYSPSSPTPFIYDNGEVGFYY